MSDQQREHLSALVDGEIDEELLGPTVSAMSASPELAATWERYHLIGGALRGEMARLEYRGIAEGVQARIVHDPLPTPTPFRRANRPSRMSPFLGAALAASAAFFAVFAVPQLFEPSPAQPAQTVALKAPMSPQRFELSAPRQRWHLDEPALQSKLDRFLVNHQAYAPSSRFKGFLPYATVVGYEVGR